MNAVDEPREDDVSRVQRELTEARTTLAAVHAERAALSARLTDSAAAAGPAALALLDAAPGGPAAFSAYRSPDLLTVLQSELATTATGRVPALFPDGSKAGYHTGKTTELRDVTEQGDLVCSRRPAFLDPICHKRALLKQVTVER